MNAATIARIAAWSVIADTELPAGTKVTVKDGQVSLRLRDGQPVHIPYGPESSLEGLCDAIRDATQETIQTGRR